ncbi:MAG: arylsulfatase [Tannerellaceae bacterium]|nr:arylsulfatase [Tannerellaceae bacterium]
MKPITNTLIACTLIGSSTHVVKAEDTRSAGKQPNIIYIMADDLGIGDLGCYGQRFIKTPAIDQMAANGVRFAQHYSGSTVSAPSRCSLMTGKHTGHTYIRGNKGVKGEDGFPYDFALKAGETTVAEIAQRHNYITACIGKWGLGSPGSEGHPNKKGFDYFFGYLGQANAHRYYPPFLFENDQKVILNKEVYSHDLIMEKALTFIEKNSEAPFFLYLTPTIPHADLIVPNNELGEYDGMFDEKPYPGPGYTPQPKPRATYAAMVSRLDRDVNRIMELLKEKGIYENTLVIFTSDNGTHKEGGHDPDALDSNGAFRGCKRDLYEGGIRTPFVVQWPARIQKGTVSYHISAFWDFLPTVCEIIGESIPVKMDGISYLPALTGEGEQKQHDYLYWEFHEEGGKQAILKDNWKLIRLQVNNPEKTYYELYNLNADPAEQLESSAQYPGKVRELKEIMDKAHTYSPIFPFQHESQK